MLAELGLLFVFLRGETVAAISGPAQWFYGGLIISAIVFPASITYLLLMRWAKSAPALDVAARIRDATASELIVLLMFAGERRARIADSIIARTLCSAGVLSFRQHVRGSNGSEYELPEEVYAYLQKHRAKIESRLNELQGEQR